MGNTLNVTISLKFLFFSKHFSKQAVLGGFRCRGLWRWNEGCPSANCKQRGVFFLSKKFNWCHLFGRASLEGHAVEKVFQGFVVRSF